MLLWMMLSFAWHNHPARAMAQALRAHQVAENKAAGGPLAAGLFSGLKNKQLQEQQQLQAQQQQQDWAARQNQAGGPQGQRFLGQRHLQEQRALQSRQLQEQRTVQQQAWQSQQAQLRQREGGLAGGLGSGITAIVQRIWPIIQADLVIGILVWLAFTVGTGVYAKQLEIWLRLHGSGDAAKIRGLGLEGATAAENEGRRRPGL